MAKKLIFKLLGLIFICICIFSTKFYTRQQICVKLKKAKIFYLFLNKNYNINPVDQFINAPRILLKIPTPNKLSNIMIKINIIGPLVSN